MKYGDDEFLLASFGGFLPTHDAMCTVFSLVHRLVHEFA